MKKILLLLVLFFSFLCYGQTPRYLKENDIQFSIQLNYGQWSKTTQKDNSISYVYFLEVRNENFIPFIKEVNKVMVFYGLDLPDKDYSYENTINKEYDTDIPYLIFWSNGNNLFEINHIEDDERLRLVYSLLTQDKLILKHYNLENGSKLIISASKNLFMISFGYPKPLNKQKKK
jgi:hypothetical protein